MGGEAGSACAANKSFWGLCVFGAPGRAMDLKKELRIPDTWEIRERERRAGPGQEKMGPPRASIGGRKERRRAEFWRGVI